MIFVYVPPTAQAIRIRGLYLSFTGGVSFSLHHGGIFALKGSVPSVSFSSDVRGTSTTTSTVTKCVKRVMVVYTRSFDFFYVHGKQLVSCRDSQLLNHTVPGQVSRRQLTSV